MKIKHKDSAITTNSKAEQSSVKRSGYKSTSVKTADAGGLFPPMIKSKLTALSKQYNLPFDLGAIKLDGKMAENVKAIRTITDMIVADSKLLPEMMKQVSRLMKADIKLAQFHVNVTKAALKHQVQLDKATADIFLAMAGYQANATRRMHRVNTRASLIERRTQAYAEHQATSVFGQQSKVIEAEFQVMASDQAILSEGRVQKAQFNQERKQKMAEYVNSAFS